MSTQRVPVPAALRSAILVEFNNCCAVCLMPAVELHHIDGDPGNNEHENLIPLCQFCHDARVHGKGFRISQVELRLYRQKRGPYLRNDALRYTALENLPTSTSGLNSIEDIEWKEGLILRFLLHSTSHTSNDWKGLKGWVRWWTVGLVEGAEVSCAIDHLEAQGLLQTVGGMWKLTCEGVEWAEKIDYWFLRQAKEVKY